MNGLPTELVNQAGTTLNAYEDQLADLRADTSLTEDAKRQRAAELWAAAVNRLRGLKRDYYRDLRARRKNLEGRMFARPSTGNATERAARQMAYRDAVARAEQVPSDEQGVALIERAETLGDDDLARAMLTIAVERGWPDTTNRYIDHHPWVDDALTEVYGITRKLNDLNHRMHVELQIAEPPTPYGLDVYSIEQLVNVDITPPLDADQTREPRRSDNEPQTMQEALDRAGLGR